MLMQSEFHRAGKQPSNHVSESRSWRMGRIPRELEIILLICAFGLLMTVWVYVSFPNFGELAEALEQFL
jgi:type II secretory pathway component PulM